MDVKMYATRCIKMDVICKMDGIVVLASGVGSKGVGECVGVYLGWSLPLSYR